MVIDENKITSSVIAVSVVYFRTDSVRAEALIVDFTRMKNLLHKRCVIIVGLV